MMDSLIIHVQAFRLEYLNGVLQFWNACSYLCYIYELQNFTKIISTSLKANESCERRMRFKKSVLMVISH